MAKSPEYGSHEVNASYREAGYEDWREVSGYFDGDGSTDYLPRKWVLHPTLSFADNFLPQLDMLNEFLVREGITTWRYCRMLGAWKLGIGRAESVRKTACSMLPFLSKKKDEVKAVVDYLENKITGTQFAEALNESVRIGNRTGSIRTVDIPYTRREGQTFRKTEMRENIVRFKAKNRIITDGVVEQIREKLLGDAANEVGLREGFEKSCQRMGSGMVNN
jgi:hypothetical protein